MASSSEVLSEDQFLCPICLDVFNLPVSTPCGHNFCLSCITSYWDKARVSRCPVCKESFQKRPDLKVNTFISELTSRFRSLHLTDAVAWSSGSQPLGGGGGGVVLCDVCTDAENEAVRSCIECLTAYCQVHLEPHRRAAGLKRHTLVEPVANLEEKTCGEHNRLLTLFCSNDGVVLCDVCASSRHARHEVLPVQQAYIEMKDLVLSTEVEVQEMIEKRLGKAQNLKESVERSKADTRGMLAKNVEELMELVSAVEKNQEEVIKVIEEKQKAAEEQVDGFVSYLERETTELQTTAANLRELQQTEDKLSFLQRYQSLVLLPHMKDPSKLSPNRLLEVQHIHKFVSQKVSQLRVLINHMSSELKRYSDGACVSNDHTLRYMQQYEVNVVLDPDTAHPLLILSDDGKQVRYRLDVSLWGQQVLNPKTFTEHLAVLGRKGFSSRKFYFEVFVGQKTEWCLGVAEPSIQRKLALGRNSHSGLWAIWFLEDKFEAFSSPHMPVYLGKVERIGVFVDYDGGEISFCNVKTAEIIHSLTECVFIEELLPYFNPCDNEYGSNLDPMVIVPVSHVD